MAAGAETEGEFESGFKMPGGPGLHLMGSAWSRPGPLPDRVFMESLKRLSAVIAETP